MSPFPKYFKIFRKILKFFVLIHRQRRNLSRLKEQLLIGQMVSPLPSNQLIYELSNNIATIPTTQLITILKSKEDTLKYDQLELAHYVQQLIRTTQYLYLTSQSNHSLHFKYTLYRL